MCVYRELCHSSLRCKPKLTKQRDNKGADGAAANDFGQHAVLKETLDDSQVIHALKIEQQNEIHDEENTKSFGLSQLFWARKILLPKEAPPLRMSAERPYAW